MKIFMANDQEEIRDLHQLGEVLSIRFNLSKKERNWSTEYLRAESDKDEGKVYMCNMESYKLYKWRNVYRRYVQR